MVCVDGMLLCVCGIGEHVLSSVGSHFMKANVLLMVQLCR
jgi:hypothetical protein